MGSDYIPGSKPGMQARPIRCGKSTSCMGQPTLLDWMYTILPAQDIPLGILALALTTWIRADGLVRQELHGHLPRALFQDGKFYEMESRVLAKHLGMDG